MNLRIQKLRWVTSCIKHLAISGLSSVLARIKSSCNLIENRFEMPNVSYTQPLWRNPLRSFRHNVRADYIRFLCRRFADFAQQADLLNPKNGSKLPSRDFANPPNRYR